MFKSAIKLGAVVVFCTTVFACTDGGGDGAGAGGAGGGVAGMIAGIGGMTGGAGGGGMTGGVGGGGMTGGVGGGMTGGMGGMTGGVGGGMTGGMGGVGGGMTGGMGGTVPTGDPTWPAIFSEIIVAKGCNAGAQCHGGPGGNLNMTTMDGAYDALVNVDAMGINPVDGNCFGTGIKRVVPMQPDMSLLVQKISHTQTCGAPMPPGLMLEPAQIEQVRMWIMAGAAEM